MSFEQELKRLYINNVDRKIKKEFTTYVKKQKGTQAQVFETMWTFYLENYILVQDRKLKDKLKKKGSPFHNEQQVTFEEIAKLDIRSKS